MLHTDRIWSVSVVESAEELARMLTEMTWSCCNAFCVKGHSEYVWLNDATSPDGAQEYAVIKLHGSNDQPLQIESITFSWCNFEEALGYITRTLQEKDDSNSFSYKVHPALQTPDQHERCSHCA